MTNQSCNQSVVSVAEELLQGGMRPGPPADAVPGNAGDKVRNYPVSFFGWGDEIIPPHHLVFK